MNYKEEDLTLLRFQPHWELPQELPRGRSIPYWHPRRGQFVTPLAVDCMSGRLDIVQLLPSHEPQRTLSPRKYTSLFFGASTRQEHDRLAIIRTLLEADANDDECSGYASEGVIQHPTHKCYCVYLWRRRHKWTDCITKCKGCDWINR